MFDVYTKPGPEMTPVNPRLATTTPKILPMQHVLRLQNWGRSLKDGLKFAINRTANVYSLLLTGEPEINLSDIQLMEDETRYQIRRVRAANQSAAVLARVWR